MSRYLNLYKVVPKSNLKASLTVTQSKSQAIEYINKKLRLDHLAHFKAWCDLRKLDYQTKDAWFNYAFSVLSQEERESYLVVKIKVPCSTIIAAFRVQCGIVPIGCSFDHPVEIEAVLQRLDPKTVEKIQEEAEKILEREKDGKQ